MAVVVERRLMFGQIAELYDRYRPAYPERLVEHLIELAGLDGRRAVVEVGAGTGKATMMFAARGIPVLAIEPSEGMARVARRNCSAYPGVRIEQSDFEEWDAAGRTFPLLFSAQAWHWVRPTTGYARAHDVLSPGGLLAAFWNGPMWARCELRDQLLAAYRTAAPGLAADGPMHPASSMYAGDDGWDGDLAATQGLIQVEVREYEWSRDYSSEDYVGFLGSTSEIRVLGEQTRRAITEAVRAAIETSGGVLTLPLRTRLCVARRG